MTTLDAAAHTLTTVWRNPGKHPAYHRIQQDRLRREWPTLHTAIDELVSVVVDMRKGPVQEWEQLELPDELQWKIKDAHPV